MTAESAWSQTQRPERPMTTEEWLDKADSALSLRDLFATMSHAEWKVDLSFRKFNLPAMGVPFIPEVVRAWADEVGYFETHNALGLGPHARTIRFPERPTEIPKLYRGAIPAKKTYWAWTHRLDQASLYTGINHGKDGRTVYTLTPPPEHVLCRLWSAEAWMIDTRGIEHLITEHQQGETP